MQKDNAECIVIGKGIKKFCVKHRKKQFKNAKTIENTQFRNLEINK